MSPNDSLKQAIHYTLADRNRLRKVKGYSRMTAALANSDYRDGEQATASDPTRELSQNLERRATLTQSVPRSLLARNRTVRREFLVEEVCISDEN